MINQLNLFQKGTPIQFKRTENGYIDVNGNVITADEIVKHSHLIVGDNGIIWVEQ